MRKKNSVAEFSTQRDAAVWNDFRRALAHQSQISLQKAFEEASNCTAPRFWVSEFRCAAVVGQWLAGNNPTQNMIPSKKEMYGEIFSRFSKLKKERPSCTITQIVSEVIEQEAPSHYMSARSVEKAIYREKKRRRLERRGK